MTLPSNLWLLKIKPLWRGSFFFFGKGLEGSYDPGASSGQEGAGVGRILRDSQDQCGTYPVGFHRAQFDPMLFSLYVKPFKFGSNRGRELGTAVDMHGTWLPNVDVGLGGGMGCLEWVQVSTAPACFHCSFLFGVG